MFFKTYTRKTDAALVTLVSRGDQGAFEELLNRHQKSVFGLACCLLGSAPDAEDISQEVFIRLYRLSGGYKPQAGLRTFLLRITRNLCIDYLRKKRPEAMATPPEVAATDTPLNRLCNAELSQQIQAVIAQLPERQRTAIHLRHAQGMNYQEIAEILGVTVKAVESLLTRARRTFRQKFCLPN